MDPMGYYLSNHCRLYPSNPRRWFHRPPQRSTVPLEAALPQEPTKTVLFPGLADWNICTCSSTSMSKIYMYYLHCIYLICKFQIGMCTHTQYIYICNIVPDVPINYNVYIYIYMYNTAKMKNVWDTFWNFSNITGRPSTC